jgi:hypothetical protein
METDPVSKTLCFLVIWNSDKWTKSIKPVILGCLTMILAFQIYDSNFVVVTLNSFPSFIAAVKHQACTAPEYLHMTVPGNQVMYTHHLRYSAIIAAGRLLSTWGKFVRRNGSRTLLQKSTFDALQIKEKKTQITQTDTPYFNILNVQDSPPPL